MESVRRRHRKRKRMTGTTAKPLPGWAATVVPINDLRLIEGDAAAATWQMLGPDPQFEVRFDPPRTIPNGHYRLWLGGTARADTAAELTHPRLYLNRGQGYWEPYSVPLSFAEAGGALCALVTVHADATQCRFDPAVRPGTLTLGPMSLEPVSRAGFYRHAISRIVGSKVRGPRTALRGLVRAFTILAQDGIKGLAAAVRQAAVTAPDGGEDYQAWIAAFDTLSAGELARMRERFSHTPAPPRISVVMPTYETPASMLREALDSVLDQAYEHWELCIADDHSTAPAVREILEEYAARDSRVKVAYRPHNGGIAAATNTAVDMATGDWIAFLDHDDRLAAHALFCMADAIVRHPEGRLFYSDEDKLDEQGVRCDPYFKPDWNVELVRSHNLVTHLAVYEAGRLRELGGLREGFDGAQDYDLVLRYTEGLRPEEIRHVPHVLYHWRVHAASTAAGDGGAKPHAMKAGERALNEHLQRVGLSARGHLIGIGYRVEYALPTPPPLVSIIIPTRNAAALVKRCVDSIRRLTTYRPYEIILVDNDSDDPTARDAFARLAAMPGLRVIRDTRPFNFSALNNAAARLAAGEVLVLLNNDTEVITPDWLGRLVSIAVQPDVGAVGAKLLFPDDTLQHGGVILGLGGLAAHAHEGLPRSSPGYVGRAALQQDVSAVTAACLAVRRELFQQVGGFDERELTIAYNDVDFCLKLRSLGLRNVWTPFAELYHRESATRGHDTTPDKQRRFDAEKAAIKRKWQTWLDRDPAYNPNLTDSRSDFSLAWPPRVWKPWLESLATPSSSAVDAVDSAVAATPPRS